MRFNLTKEEMHDHLKVKKAALISIAINVLEIVAGIVMLTLVRRMLLGGVEESIVRMVSLLCFTIVGWGALTDIGASLTSLRMVRRTQELEEAYSQLEDLNREMRAQRHDFMNHIQVVYSLIEMNEPGEAMTYMDKLYGDMQRVSRMMRTACPAVNALIQAKVVEARQRGAELKLSIAAKWDDPLMPAWEICRVLANLIDNALDAATRSRRSNWFWARICAVGSSPCATTGRPSRKSSAPKSSSRVSPPSGRGRAWVFSLSIRRLRNWAGGSRWIPATGTRCSPALCRASD